MGKEMSNYQLGDDPLIEYGYYHGLIGNESQSTASGLPSTPTTALLLYHRGQLLQWEVGEISEDGRKVQTSSYKINKGTSLVAQWLRIRMPLQGTWVRALVREDPTCHGATKPVQHNY
ncbi:hypothetical protein J1605_020202 [Eschrichtius robustus]|uniref:Uncharacterized protein n=1 Tax=Eschrichtius robustus TaxID=9764 RepID=A0AB34HMG6_ESCRO|nr:hypothetical protein J1605_020202 [Eschrichtius robustus]